MKKNKKWIIIGVIAGVVIIGYHYYKKHPEKFGVSTTS
ncbi:MAG: tetratricopeptide repeat protein [Prevotellaceae bacterium]|nr:tetratricopeptide repeat protein [Prevotellaceae bacterium]